ncbi:shikimate dehydrogenase [Paenibacillus sp. FSL R7-0273]|uniref:shikimate dehydrogenase n=1 Tax=Paenibacillus sp. FSL R7-0273 TaxID=1536772 RepID=UPI0004F7895E|nr:shikimate dehydrogenase [Paenibacillus sp. FSL R7-0273]AIQ45913.1 shikimate dehydrogenase [Paenibacillus sp. FSL R7-0273]OMF87437.1 shikimate dehydrogenase [Paenibacillus sp. FSL R7-0273]
MTGNTTNTDMLLGVMGDPIAQSKSPLMHTAALKALGIPGAYVPLHIAPGQLGEAVQAIRTLGFRGINVTIPHKIAVMEYLDRLDESALAGGAVNTIVNDNGVLTGYNTDGIGYVRSLKAEAAPELAGARILVLGAGGAARGVISALLQENPASVVIANRTADKAHELAASWQAAGSVTGVSMEEIAGIIPDSDIVINTTSVGMYPYPDELPLDPGLLHKGLVVSDLIYNPLRTRLLEEGLKAGCSIHGGLGMFIYQGAYALEYWTGRAAPVETMRQAMLEAFGVSEADM